MMVLHGLVDGLGMHLEWSCNDTCMVLMWNALLSICSDLSVFSLPPLLAMVSCPQG